MRIVYFLILIIVAIFAGGFFVLESAKDSFGYSNSVVRQSIFTNVNSEIVDETIGNTTKTPEVEIPLFIPPVQEFTSRITKKPFGIYITPSTSPVQPEKFTGYHTGVDVEFEDVADDVPVVAIADGDVVFSGYVSGYGGVVIIRHTLEDGEPVLAIYGHLNNARSVKKDATVKQGDTIGYLGGGGTTQTDYERKHLHFGIIKGAIINYRGYVSSEDGLNAWYDPVTFYVTE